MFMVSRNRNKNSGQAYILYDCGDARDSVLARSAKAEQWLRNG